MTMASNARTALLVLTLTAGGAGAQVASDYALVTDERLENPEPGNWLMFRRTYDGAGYSPLDQIDTRNVDELVPVWSVSTGITEGHQAPPLVNDGVMFVTTPLNYLLAIDARDGDVLWRYQRQMPFDIQIMHPTNRGVALYGDKVYMATTDAVVVALDAVTGEVVWETPVEDYNGGYYMTLAPLAVRGQILVGVSGGERGIRGFVTALDAETGELEDPHHSGSRRVRQRHLARRHLAARRRAGLGHGYLRPGPESDLLGHGQPGPVDRRCATRR